jgi:hypothetical protein
MRTRILTTFTLLCSLIQAQPGEPQTRGLDGYTDIPAGSVSGTWMLIGSPYRIHGEITIPNDSTLTIEPGVEVIFMGHYKFNVQGRLTAVGTKGDSIKFDAIDTFVGWHGIRFDNTPSTNDTSKITYCSLKHGMANTGSYTGADRCGGAIFIRRFDKIIVSHSLFDSNMNDGDIAAATGGACIYIDHANPQIMNSTFANNVGTTDCAILCWYSDAVISNNTFLNNCGPHGPLFCGYNAPIVTGNIVSGNVTTRAGGAIFTMTSNALVTNNIMVHNQSFGQEGEGGGIKCWISDKSVFVNNTVAYNIAAHGGGICCNSGSHPVFLNNIVWGNTSADGNQVNLVDAQSDPDFLYCDIQGRQDEFAGSGAGANYSGRYEGNIDLDPIFMDTTSSDYSLSSPSHCIGSGVDSASVNGITFYAPAFDIWGYQRPNPAGSRPDMGACESGLGTPDFSEAVDLQCAIPTGFDLCQNYPNPFNPNTTIRFTLPNRSNVTLTVFNLMGQEITSLVEGEKEAGFHEVLFDGSHLESGVYFCRLQAEGFTQTRKLIIIK